MSLRSASGVWVPEGDPTCQNVMDQAGDGDMKLGLMIATGIIGMHSRPTPVG
jgi:hypothetical protein